MSNSSEWADVVTAQQKVISTARELIAVLESKSDLQSKVIGEQTKIIALQKELIATYEAYENFKGE